MTMKGLVTVRRDNAPFVGSCASEAIRMLMDVGVSDARTAVKQHVTDILLRLERGEVPVQDLTIRKELKQWVYKTPTPHATLALKLVERAREQALFREYVKEAYETPGGYDDARLCSFWAKLADLRSYLSTRAKREVLLGEMVESMRTDGTSPFRAEAYAVSALRWLYDELLAFVQDESNSREVGLAVAGIGNAHELGERYMAFVRYDAVDWQPPTLGERIPYVITRGRGDISSRAEDPRMVDIGRCKPDFLYYIDHQLRNPMVDLLRHVMESPSDLFADSHRRITNTNLGRNEITSFFKRQKK